VSGITVRKAGLVTIPGAQRKILIPIHIRPLAEFVPEDGLQSGLDIKSEIPLPVMRALSSTKGIYELNADHWSLLDIDAKLRAELASALGSRGNYPMADRKDTEDHTFYGWAFHPRLT
jgi:hypothetical protein